MYNDTKGSEVMKFDEKTIVKVDDVYMRIYYKPNYVEVEYYLLFNGKFYNINTGNLITDQYKVGMLQCKSYTISTLNNWHAGELGRPYMKVGLGYDEKPTILILNNDFIYTRHLRIPDCKLNIPFIYTKGEFISTIGKLQHHQDELNKLLEQAYTNNIKR